MSFKGIGPYTVGAIRSFAFGRRAAILDTNVARVLHRVFVGRGNVKAHAMRQRLWALSWAVLPTKHVFDFNQALMDFGRDGVLGPASILRGLPHDSPLPVRCSVQGEGARVTTRTVIVVLAAIVERDGRLLVTRRLRGTHLEGLWEFPGGKCEPGETHEACLARELAEELGVVADVGREVYCTEHMYTDRTIRLHFRECALRSEPVPQLGQQMRWLARSALDAREFPPADAELIAVLRRSESDDSGSSDAGSSKAAGT